MMPSENHDVESPMPVPVSSSISKLDQGSVGTDPSEADDHSDHDASTSSRTSRLALSKTLFIVLLLIAAIAVSVGLVFGLGSGRETSASNSAASEPPATYTIDIPYSQESASEISDAETSKGSFQEKPASESTEAETSEEPLQEKPPNDFFAIGSMESNEEWPELVGSPGTEAKKILDALGLGYEVLIVPPGTPVTKDLRFDRIFLFVDEEGNVAMVPRPGR
jgi:Potato inhibitor I family